MPSTPQSARAIARRLIELEESRPRSHPTTESAPLEACYRLHLILSTWVGGTGARTLMARALRMAGQEHPVLEELSISGNGRPYFDRVDDAIAAYDSAAVVAGIEAFIEALLGLLTRFIGADMVASLAERTADPEPDHSDTKKVEP